MNNRHAGSCLCGQMDTGSAHAANLFSSTAALKWVSGSNKVRQFTLPATRHNKAFCGTCGSALPMMQLDGKLLVVPAGSLNSEVTLRPVAHIFAASKASWDHELENVPTVDGFP